MSGAFASERGADGVLVLTLDVPGEKVNTLGAGGSPSSRGCSTRWSGTPP